MRGAAVTCLAALLTCLASSMAACLIGAAQVAGRPLSDENLAFSLTVGAFLGALSAVVVSPLVLVVDANVRPVVVGVGATLTASLGGLAFYWWCAITASC